MTVPYCLHCSVCKNDYSSKSQWLNHLTQEEHQNLAKQKCCLNWRKPDKDKCLVIYSSFPVTVTSGGAQKGIQYFSPNLRNWVTDFVNWEERPYFAIVQFESRKKAQQIVSAITKPDLMIDGCRVQIKLASELRDLEWNSHLPRHSVWETNNLVQSRRKLSLTTDEITETLTKKSKKDTTTVAPCCLSDDRDNPVNNISTFEVDLVYRSDFLNSLQQEFWEVCNTMTLPDDKYNMFLELGRYLETLFCKIDPQSRVVLFRNYHLKLADPKWDSSDMLLFYAYYTGRSSSQATSTAQKVFHSRGGKQDFPSGLLSPRKGVNWGPTYIYKHTNQRFTVITKKNFIVEAQLCQLLEYMCLFDNRCHSLLAICWFWCKQNVLVFSELKDPLKKPGITSDPLTMEWLMIHYLCHMGILPTVREIQQRKHQELNYQGVDIGFCADPGFVQEWKSKRKDEEISKHSEEFTLSVLELFQGFLKFYGETLAKDKWILNTRDGEVIKRENVLPEMYKSNEIPYVDLYQYDLYMVNPLICTWRFSVYKKIHCVLDKMKGTADQLETYLKMGRCKRIDANVNLTEALTFKKPEILDKNIQN